MNGRLGMMGGALVLLVGGAAAAEPAPGGFAFSTPPGWIDVSRGAPEALRSKAPPSVLALSNDPGTAFVAYEPGSDDDGFIENVNAIVRTGERPPLATPAVLNALEKGIKTGAAAQGLTYRSLETDVVKVAGVTAGRLVGELNGPSGAVISVLYAIPGQRAHAMLTFTTTPDKLAHYRPIFDATAQATLGAVEPIDQASYSLGTLVGIIIGGLAGGLGARAALRAKRKRQAGAPSPSPP
jgi:hypothetical protein